MWTLIIYFVLHNQIQQTIISNMTQKQCISQADGVNQEKNMIAFCIESEGKI